MGIDIGPALAWLKSVYGNLKVADRVWNYEDDRYDFCIYTDNQSVRPLLSGQMSVNPQAVVNTFAHFGISAIIENRPGGDPYDPRPRKCVRIDAREVCLRLNELSHAITADCNQFPTSMRTNYETDVVYDPPRKTLSALLAPLDEAAAGEPGNVVSAVEFLKRRERKQQSAAK